MATRAAVVWTLNLAATAAAFVFTALRYRFLAERLPIHWNVRGEPDSWAPRRFGAWLMPATLLGLQVFWFEVRSMAGVTAAELVLAWIQTATSAFLLFVTVLMLDAGMEERGRMSRAIWVGLGVFLLAVVAGAGLSVR